MHRGAVEVLATAIALTVLVAAWQGPAAGQVPGQELVPINVRVLDGSGKPVTGLGQGDFVVTEDGVSRPIRQFAYRVYAAGAAVPTVVAARQGLAVNPQAGRLFVIALGLGRLEEASKAITSLIAFVRTKLLPQDMVAVFAYDRALPFTADHEKVAQVLERFRKAHGDIDLEIGLQMGPRGMAALYGRRTLPPKVQGKINEVFDGPGASPTPALQAPDSFEAGDFVRLLLDDFMFSTAQTLLDQSNLNVLMEYLRRCDGEKHVLFVTERGFPFPSDEGDRTTASLANDARASIHPIQVGGLVRAEAGKETTADHLQALSFRSLRTIAELTGGLSDIVERGGATVGRIDEVSRGSYVIGFPPASGWDGRYRTITVKVSRPDVTLLYRHGYYATPEVGGFNRRAQVTADRLMAGGNFRREISDIKIKMAVSQKVSGTLTIAGKIDLSKITLIKVEGGRATTLDVAVFSLDSAGQPTGSEVRTLPVKISDEEFPKYQKDGLPYVVEVPMPRGTQSVRFVVYDYAGDVIGRADAKVF